MATKAQQVEFLISANPSLAGGSSTFYIAGSSHADADKKTVWQDRNKTTPAANPVTLDAVNGTAVVFGDGVYDVVLKTAAGAALNLLNIEIASKTSTTFYNVALDFDGDLAAALSSPLTAGKSVVVTTAIMCDSDITRPADRQIRIEYGGSIEPAVGKTFDWNGGRPESGLYQIFGGAGTIAGLIESRPDWWGTGTSAAGKAFAAVSAYGQVILAKGQTYMSPGVYVTGKHGLLVTGGGKLKFVNGITDGQLLVFDGCDDLTVDGIELDGNISGGSEGERGGLVVVDIAAPCNRVVIQNNKIHSFKGTNNTTATGAPGIAVNGAVWLTIKNNRIIDTDVNIILRRCINYLVDGNFCGGGYSEALSMWDSSTVVPSEDGVITNNTFLKTVAISSVKRLLVANNIFNNSISLSSDTDLLVGGGGPGISYPFIAEDVTVHNNSFKHAITLGVQNAALTDITAKNITVSDNKWQLNNGFAIFGKYKSDKTKIINNRVKAEQNLTSVFSFTEDTNMVVTGNNIDANGYTVARFINAPAASTPVRILNNTLTGSPTNEGIWIRATTTTGCEASYNYLPSGYISAVSAGVKLTGNTSNRSGPESVASTATVSLYASLATNDDAYKITGTTGITSITATRSGHVVTLQFQDAGCVVTDGGNLRLAGNFTSTASSTLTIRCDGTNWFEISRSAN